MLGTQALEDGQGGWRLWQWWAWGRGWAGTGGSIVGMALGRVTVSWEQEGQLVTAR